jgi:hypothetical protein
MTIVPDSQQSQYPKVAAKLNDLNQLQSCPSTVGRITKAGIDSDVKNLGKKMAAR